MQEIRKPQVLRATIEALYERGVDGIRVSDIAEGVGIHPSTVLHYIPSRERLIEEALDFSDQSYYAELHKRVAEQGAPVAQLRWLFHRFSHSPEKLDDWTLFMEIWVCALRQPQLRKLQQRIQRRLRSVTEDVLEQGIATGQFAAVDVEETALVLTSLMDGLGVQRTLEDPAVPAERMEALMLAMASRLLDCDLLAEQDDEAGPTLSAAAGA
ncbi:MAG: TetR family transcriptional regulator C-terminal domain-containing protein [Pseudonocardiaceae bacterium]